MFTHPDTIATVVQIERTLALQRADQRTRLLVAATPRRSVRGDASILPRTGSGRSLARALRSLRWVLRPAHV